MPNPPNANVSELFCSLQGEGLYAGAWQLFIRFGVCPLRCRYCDQPEALVAAKQYRVETEPGATKFEIHDNPVTVERLIAHVDRFAQFFPSFHSVSLTGGEPLVHARFLAEALPEFKRRNLRIFLETAGVHHRELQTVLPWTDIVSMDIKIPSTTGETPRYEDNRTFLALASSRDCYAKVVIGAGTTPAEMDEVCALVGPHSTPLFLQPVTPVDTLDKAPTLQAIRSLVERCAQHGVNARVLPQIHKTLRIL